MMNNVEPIVLGAEVFGSDNEKLGAVAEVSQDHFLVHQGFLYVRDLSLPRQIIARVEEESVYLTVSKDEAENIAQGEWTDEGMAR